MIQFNLQILFSSHHWIFSENKSMKEVAGKQSTTRWSFWTLVITWYKNRLRKLITWLPRMARRTSNEAIENVENAGPLKSKRIDKDTVGRSQATQNSPRSGFWFMWMRLKQSPNRNTKHLYDWGWWWDGSRISHEYFQLEKRRRNLRSNCFPNQFGETTTTTTTE